MTNITALLSTFLFALTLCAVLGMGHGHGDKLYVDKMEFPDPLVSAKLPPALPVELTRATYHPGKLLPPDSKGIMWSEGLSGKIIAQYGASRTTANQSNDVLEI